MDSDEEFDSADERPTIEDNFTEHDNNESSMYLVIKVGNI